MGCVLGKLGLRKAASSQSDNLELDVPKDIPDDPQKQPGVSRDDYNDKHPGAHNSGHKPSDPPAVDPHGNFKTKEESDVLKVVSVNFMVSENAKAHHTESYELTHQQEKKKAEEDKPAAEDGEKKKEEEEESKTEPSLVVRRGESFDISIKFDRPFDSQTDDIRLVFDTGDKPRESRGTRIVLLLSDEDEPRKWGAKMLREDAEEFMMRIFTPPHLAVAKWNFHFDTILKTDDEKCKIFRYSHPQNIYVLFNPWCADDQVFMSDEKSRQEYVLKDTGRIFCGTRFHITSKPWNFGQFEDFVLDLSMYVLDTSGLNFRVRGDPVQVVRKISAMANAPDDNGILVGNWSGDYSDGTSPLSWNGSVAILEQYWKEHESVNYGQCWVFSGVVTTICRCLGIPCRSVTNFVSAHDCDGSLTIDAHWDSDGNPLEEYNEDSVWNFHVWNDVWMMRPDLPSGFGGWQAIDATPQETSEGVYCAGPASLEAIKNGLVQLPYDGPFIFAEVNADKVHCIQDKDGQWKHTFEASSIGKNISTKGPDGDDRLDITSLYKYLEGSQQERTAVWRAVSTSSTNKQLYKVEAEDMTFDMVRRSETLIGEMFDVTLKIHNKSEEKRTVRVTFSVSVVHYTGVPVCTIKTKSRTTIVKPNKDDEVSMPVLVDEYLPKVTDMCHIKISSMSQVVETNQFHCETEDFRLSKPLITVNAPKEVKLGEECEIEASFRNPLSHALTDCLFNFESPSLQKLTKMTYENVPAKGAAKGSFKITAQKAGEKEIIVGFSSKELSALTGTARIKIIDSNSTSEGDQETSTAKTT